MAIMRAAQWKRGKTGPELARKWKMAQGTLESIAAEAWRRLAAEENPDEVRVLASDTLRALIEEAMAETREPAMVENGVNRDGSPRVYQESPNGARRVVVEATKVLVALVGAAEPAKIEVTEAVKKLTPEQVAEELRAALAELERG